MKWALTEFGVQLLVVLLGRHIRPDRADRPCKEHTKSECEDPDYNVDEKHNERAFERRIAHAERPKEKSETSGKPDIFC